MAAKNTVNAQKMQAAATQLENINATMLKQIKSLEETMSAVKQAWTGEAATSYLKQYQKNEKAFNQMAEAIKSASISLKESSETYTKADNSAMDLVNKLGRRG